MLGETSFGSDNAYLIETSLGQIMLYLMVTSLGQNRDVLGLIVPIEFFPFVE